MTTLKKSLQTLASIAAIGGFIAATPLPAMAQTSNPCAPKASAANPCASKVGNPCAPKDKAAKAKGAKAKAANPCAPKR